MGLRINTNVQSLTAQRYLASNLQNQQNSLSKLSSGQRITRAADDAAGLAISEKMRADIRSIAQDVRNANDGISMIQTAEGSMNEIGNLLIRFRELSIQAASDTIGDNERMFVDKEVQQLKQELDRISATTEFSGKKLLSGEGGESLEIQVGLNNNPADRFIYNLAGTVTTAERLGVSELNVLTKEQAQQNLTQIDAAISTLSGNRAELGALQNRLQSGVNNLTIYNENLSTARSRIADADMAVETADLTKSNIPTSATTAVLSQANQNSMMALKLLG